MPVETIEIPTKSRCVPQTFPCPRCDGRAVVNEHAILELRKSDVAIDFVFHGWTCRKCQRSFPPDDVAQEIQRVSYERMALAGLLPMPDDERVKLTRAIEAKRRIAARRSRQAS